MIDKKYIETMLERIEEYIKIGLVSEKTEIYITPLDETLVYILELFQKHNISIAGIIDSRKKYHTTIWDGIKITAAEDVLIPYRKNKIIIVTAPWDIPLMIKLDALEYWHNVNRFWPCEPLPMGEPSWLKRQYHRFKGKLNKAIFHETKMVYSGYKVYKKLPKIDQVFYFFPHRSLGDIYILGLYLQAKTSLFEKEFTLCVVGKGCETLAKYMGFRNVVQLTQREMDGICRWKMVQKDKVSGEILHFHYIYHAVVPKILEDNVIPFKDCYDLLVFDDCLKEKLNKVSLPRNDVSKICEKYGLVKAKSVVIAPYAKSIPEVHFIFWQLLANALLEKNYTVFTNCNGISEPPLLGTKTMPIDLCDAISVIEFAGVFIGLRSGFCDLISSADARKICIFHESKENSIDYKSYFTMYDIVGSHTWKEYEYTDKNCQLLVTEIVKQLEIGSEGNTFR